MKIKEGLLIAKWSIFAKVFRPAVKWGLNYAIKTGDKELIAKGLKLAVDMTKFEIDLRLLKEAFKEES